VNRRQDQKTRWIPLVVLAVAAILVAGFGRPAAKRTASLIQSARLGRKTVLERVAEFGGAVDARLMPAFNRSGVGYPPVRLALISLKSEQVLQLYAADAVGSYRLIREYPILAASGEIGPKLREGDGQVPEGIYRIESLNPNSAFHLSLRVNYPNEFDRSQARLDGRQQLGGDIMIHGGAASVGCLAMGDEAAEDLFVLAARTGLPNITVVIAPVDFRSRGLPVGELALPSWSEQLYASVKVALQSYPAPPEGVLHSGESK
jgi:hypothetical protein